MLAVATRVGTAAEPTDRPDPKGQPTTVAFGIYVLDISRIDGASQSFTADVLVVARWRDSRLASEKEGPHTRELKDVWHPRLEAVNQQGAIAALPEVVEVDAVGTVTYRQRFQGQFSSPMQVVDFPFDRHECQFRFATLGYTESEIRFENREFADVSGMARRLLIADWDVGPWSVATEPYQLAPHEPKRAGFVFKFMAKRHAGFYVLKIVLPLVFIVLMSWVVFWIDPVHVSSQMTVAATAMLTLIAYRLSYEGYLPRVSYLTRMDTFMLGSTILVLLSLVEVAISNNLAMADKKVAAVRVDRWSRVLFPVVFAALLVWSLVL